MIALYFRNAQSAKHLLELQREHMNPVTKTIKTFSVTRWNGCAVMFESILRSREAILSEYTNKITRQEGSEFLLDLEEKYQKLKFQGAGMWL